jgi:hypothetical protein
VRGKSGSRYAAGGAAVLEEAPPARPEPAAYPEVAPPPEGLRAARRERDPEVRADMLAGILAYRSGMKAARLRAEEPSHAVMKRVEGAFARADPGNNFVRLADLRSYLPDLPRVKVDAAILGLVKRSRYSLDTHEGNWGKLTRRQRRAGLAGPGRDPLVYMAKR